jgi:hypothetical protein
LPLRGFEKYAVLRLQSQNDAHTRLDALFHKISGILEPRSGEYL